MDSDFKQQNHHHHFQDQQQHHKQHHQMNNLTRFRSAPSSYYASFLDAIDSTIEPITQGGASYQQQQQQQQNRVDFVNAGPLSPETENIFARFMSSMDEHNNSNSNINSELCSVSEDMKVVDQTRYVVKQEIETPHHQQKHQHENQQQTTVYQSQSKPPLASRHNAAVHPAASVIDQSSFHGGLIRHSSSPAGFFSNIINLDNDFGVIKGMGDMGSGGGDSQLYFSSANSTTTTSVLLNQSSETGTKGFKSVGDSSINNNNDHHSNYMTGYPPMSSWDDSVVPENQDEEGRNRPPTLCHHLSLPKTSAELLAREKLLQFQDTVPCKIRAKRGFATHPRSIAERVRRTKISERMRKLQDLVPNMDKQTNTADMLDLAVEYIKDLQNQVKNLNDNRAKCSCC